MANKMTSRSTLSLCSTRSISAGFTLIELMIVLSIIIILLTVVLPSFNSMLAKSDLQAAQENVKEAFQYAKSTARMAGQSVTITINTNSNKITFSVPNGTNILLDNTKMLPVNLPEKITITATNKIYIFSPNGLINDQSAITLTSTRDNTFSSNITILNLLGHIVIS